MISIPLTTFSLSLPVLLKAQSGVDVDGYGNEGKGGGWIDGRDLGYGWRVITSGLCGPADKASYSLAG